MITAIVIFVVGFSVSGVCASYALRDYFHAMDKMDQDEIDAEAGTLLLTDVLPETPS